MKYILFLLLGLSHPLYLSFTSVNYSDKTQTFQITSKLFLDDLEKGVLKEGGIHINVENPANRVQVNNAVAAYVKNHIKLHINLKRIQLNYKGYRVIGDVAWCFFESERVGASSALQIDNDLFVDIYPNQVNMLNLKIGSLDESVKMDINKTTYHRK
jgi:hypothetical protein